LVPGSIAAQLAGVTGTGGDRRLDIEHPSGFFTVDMSVTIEGNAVVVQRSALVRTARKLMYGAVFVPHAAWDGERNAGH
jgi:4-oxalomesaconate tautomerase